MCHMNNNEVMDRWRVHGTLKRGREKWCLVFCVRLYQYHGLIFWKSTPTLTAGHCLPEEKDYTEEVVP